MGHILFGDRNGDSGSWIAARPRWMVVQPKTSETTDFDTITLRQGAPDGVEDFLDSDVCVFLYQRRKAGCDGGDQISASHVGILPSVVRVALNRDLKIGDASFWLQARKPAPSSAS